MFLPGFFPQFLHGFIAANLILYCFRDFSELGSRTFLEILPRVIAYVALELPLMDSSSIVLRISIKIIYGNPLGVPTEILLLENPSEIIPGITPSNGMMIPAEIVSGFFF